MSDETSKKTFPEFPGMSKALVCDVTQGQMLYLPAGMASNDRHKTHFLHASM